MHQATVPGFNAWHDQQMRSSRERWEDAVDIPLTISTVAFLVAYAWPILDPGLSPELVVACRWTTWITWAMLGVDYAARLTLTSNRPAFLSKTPFDLLFVLLPLLRPLRLLRLVTLLSMLNRYAGNSLRGKVGIYLVGSVTLIVFVASLAVLDAERGGAGPIQTFGDAVWWSITTITTVGYGDFFPITTTGRMIAGGLMLAGIAVLGVVTASIASWLIERVAEVEETSDAATRRDMQALTVEVQALRERLEDPTEAQIQKPQ